MTSDRQGFEYVELGPQRLPGAPASYLDVYPSGREDPSYGFERLDIGGHGFVRYSRYLRIHPNDSETNRGAYLSAGFITGRALPLHVAANCMDLVAQVVGHLKSLLGPGNSVDRNFRLANYAYNGDLSESAIEARCSPLLLLDVLLQGLNGQGSLSWKGRKPIFLDAARLARDEDVDKHLFYFGKGTPAVQLKLERDREKLKDLTRQLALVASYADQVQDEWLSYQAAMQERLPAMASRGTELRDLIEEVERLTETADRIEASPRGAARAFAAFPSTFAAAPPPTGAYPQAAAYPPSAAVSRQAAAPGPVHPAPGPHGPRAARGRMYRFPSRGRHDRRVQKARRFRWIALGIGAALLVSALVAAVTLRFVGDPFERQGAETVASPLPAEDTLGRGSPPSAAPTGAGTDDASGNADASAGVGDGSGNANASAGGGGASGNARVGVGDASGKASANATTTGSVAEPRGTNEPRSTADAGSTGGAESPRGPGSSSAAESAGPTKTAPSSVAQERAALGRSRSE